MTNQSGEGVFLHLFKVNFMLLFIVCFEETAAGFVNRDLRFLPVWGVRPVREN